MKEAKVLTFVNKRVNIKLVRIACDRWDVLAVLDQRDRCQVLDFLDGRSPAQRLFLRFLRTRLPVDGPPANNADLCKPLGEGIFEFRRQPKGPKLRILFFYDGGFRIVCTNAFRKAERTPGPEIELARGLRERYFRAKLLGRLRIEEIEDE